MRNIRNSNRPLSAALCFVIILGSCKREQIEYPSSQYVRQKTGNRIAIVFVHGLFGDAKTTWTSRNGKYWPDLLVHDPHFDRTNVFVYSYPSPVLGKSFTIDDLADNMRLVFDEAEPKLFDHDEVIFLTHSMGGVVVRAFLLKYRNMAQK